jgi:hypothetical protein
LPAAQRVSRHRLAVLLLLAALAASGCAVSSAGPAIRVSNTQAAVQGVIASTVGGTGSYWVKYGTDTTYGSETAHRQTTFFPGGESRSVDVTLQGLAPETVYHYRLCSRDGASGTGPGCSPDRSFRTGLACGTVIAQDTKLTADMECESGSALVVGAAGVTLDMAAHTIRGGDSEGAEWLGIDNSAGHDGVIVKNGTVHYAQVPTVPAARSCSRMPPTVCSRTSRSRAPSASSATAPGSPASASAASRSRPC